MGSITNENNNNENNDKTNKDNKEYGILANRNGYIKLNSSLQLNNDIKRINNPINKSCKIEGILYNLFKLYRYKIMIDKEKIDTIKKELIKELNYNKNKDNSFVIESFDYDIHIWDNNLLMNNDVTTDDDDGGVIIDSSSIGNNVIDIEQRQQQQQQQQKRQ